MKLQTTTTMVLVKPIDTPNAVTSLGPVRDMPSHLIDPVTGVTWKVGSCSRSGRSITCRAWMIANDAQWRTFTFELSEEAP